MLLKYLSLKYVCFMRIGTGAVQYLISLRSSSFCDFFERLAVHASPRLVFLISVISSTLPLIDNPTAVRALALFILLTLAVCSLQAARAWLRGSINHTYEESNSLRIEILESYEQIHSYGILNDELALYSARVQRCSLLKQIFDCSGHIINLILGASLIGISAYIWRATPEGSNFSTVLLLTEDLKSSLHSVLTEVDQLIVDFANFRYSRYARDEMEAATKLEQPCSFTDEIAANSLSVARDGQTLLEGVTFRIKKAEKTAITGPNGSGKSVLMAVLTGNMEYDGSLSIDGTEIRQMSRRRISSLIGYVPQRGGIFNKSIEDNLKIAREVIENEELVETCRVFECHELFKTLGYSKVVGNSGCLLSGGQRQRVLLLGAIMKGSEILVLDGAFTGLDEQTEEGFVDRLVGLKDKTVVCSTQNVRLLMRFESVIFVDKGRVWKGTYDELMRTNEAFVRYISGGVKPKGILGMFRGLFVRAKAV